MAKFWKIWIYTLALAVLTASATATAGVRKLTVAQSDCTEALRNAKSCSDQLSVVQKACAEDQKIAEQLAKDCTGKSFAEYKKSLECGKPVKVIRSTPVYVEDCSKYGELEGKKPILAWSRLPKGGNGWLCVWDAEATKKALDRVEGVAKKWCEQADVIAAEANALANTAIEYPEDPATAAAAEEAKASQAKTEELCKESLAAWRRMLNDINDLKMSIQQLNDRMDEVERALRVLCGINDSTKPLSLGCEEFANELTAWRRKTDQRLTKVEGRVDRLEDGQQKLTKRVDDVEKRVDRIGRGYWLIGGDAMYLYRSGVPDSTGLSLEVGWGFNPSRNWGFRAAGLFGGILNEWQNSVLAGGEFAFTYNFSEVVGLDLGGRGNAGLVGAGNNEGNVLAFLGLSIAPVQSFVIAPRVYGGESFVTIIDENGRGPGLTGGVFGAGLSFYFRTLSGNRESKNNESTERPSTTVERTERTESTTVQTSSNSPLMRTF